MKLVQQGESLHLLHYVSTFCVAPFSRICSPSFIHVRLTVIPLYIPSPKSFTLNFTQKLAKICYHLSAVLHTKLHVVPEIHCLFVHKQTDVRTDEISSFCYLWKTWNYFVHDLPNKASMLCDNSRHLPETEVTTSSAKAKKHTHLI